MQSHNGQFGQPGEDGTHPGLSVPSFADPSAPGAAPNPHMAQPAPAFGAPPLGSPAPSPVQPSAEPQGASPVAPGSVPAGYPAAGYPAAGYPAAGYPAMQPAPGVAPAPGMASAPGLPELPALPMQQAAPGFPGISQQPVQPLLGTGSAPAPASPSTAPPMAPSEGAFDAPLGAPAQLGPPGMVAVPQAAVQPEQQSPVLPPAPMAPPTQMAPPEVTAAAFAPASSDGNAAIMSPTPGPNPPQAGLQPPATPSGLPPVVKKPVDGGLPPSVKRPIELKLPASFRGASASQLQSKRLRIGEVLIEMSLISEEQLMEALEKQRESGKRLGQVLQDDGYVSAGDIAQALARKLNIDFIDLSDAVIPEELFYEHIPLQLCNRYGVIPIAERDGVLVLAMGDPTNVFALDDIKLVTGRDLEIVVAAPDAIDLALTQFVNLDEHVQTAVSQAEDWADDFVELEDVKDSDADAPAIRLANQIITQAVTLGASDLHFEPQADSMVIRFRKDGVLQHVTNVPTKLAAGVTSRLKIMGNMDISERRRPQDGRVGILVGGRPIDLRVAVLPTVYGEKTVMRVLDKSNVMLTMDQLGFLPEQLKKLRYCYTQPYGCLLVTGPTGSGKSTTLYAALNEVNDVEKNIITVEDPVEYRLSGINQVQVNIKAGLTFAGALRSILRCDPDIVMIGEMRDQETASIGIEAALTGHLVLSTLHTNTAPGAITRLTEMDIEPFLVSSSILGVLAQRLARRLCKCKVEWVPDRDYLSEMGYPEHVVDGEPPQLFRAKEGGCQRCNGKGYRGRMGLHEVMLMSEEIAALAIQHASAEEIARTAVDQGMITLFDDGVAKILRGDTTMEELQRVVQH